MTSKPNPSLSQAKFQLMRLNKLDKLNYIHDEVFSTPNGDVVDAPNFTPNSKSSRKGNDSLNGTQYYTPRSYQSQVSHISSSSVEEYSTPNGSITGADLSPKPVELKKSCSCTAVEHAKNMSTIAELSEHNVEPTNTKNFELIGINSRESLGSKGVLRSKSNFEITRVSPTPKTESVFQRLGQKSDSLLAFLTPHLKRRNASFHSTPKNPSPSGSLFRVPSSPIVKRHLRSLPETRATSLSSLKGYPGGTEGTQFGIQQVER